jgi:hypothetical protein
VCQTDVYVGETGRLLQTRKNEHTSKVMKRDLAQGSESAVDE